MRATIEHVADGYIIATLDGRIYHRCTLSEAIKTCHSINATYHII